MNTSSTTGKLIMALKQQLRAKGLHYSDIAVRMKITERTVKRYFSGKGVTVEILEQMAEVVDLDLFSLTILAQQEHMPEGGLTNAQQAALRQNTATISVYNFLSLGFTPAQLAEEFDLGNSMESILRRLESLGLIRRLSANSVKMLVLPKFGGELVGFVREHKIKSTARFLSEIDLSDEACEWMYYGARLSPAAMVRVRQLIYRIVKDIEVLTKSEIGLPAREVQWYRFFVGTEPVNPKRLLQQN